MSELDGGTVHLLRLAAKGAKENGGWAPVSDIVWPLLDKVPAELLERERNEDGSGRCRLTPTGEAVLPYL